MTKASAKTVAKHAADNGDVPVIDFSQLSYDDSMAMNRIEATIQRVQILAQRTKSENVPDSVLDELLKLTHPDEMDKVADQVRQYMARVVRYVPRSWLVERAPESLDFGNAETYRWLRQDKTPRLRQMIRLAQTADEAAKN